MQFDTLFVFFFCIKILFNKSKNNEKGTNVFQGDLEMLVLSIHSTQRLSSPLLCDCFIKTTVIKFKAVLLQKGIKHRLFISSQ